jgi:hypothetical protein
MGRMDKHQARQEPGKLCPGRPRPGQPCQNFATRRLCWLTFGMTVAICLALALMPLWIPLLQK